MKDQKNKGALGILSLILWAALLTVIARLLAHHSGWDLNGILCKILLWVMQCITIFFCWWIFTGLRLNRFIKRLNETGYTYLRTHDVDAYLREIDTCCEMPGVKNAVISGIPARDYVMILKIRTLRESGRGEEARALLEIAQQSMKGEKTQLLLKAEEAHPGSVRPKPEGDCVPCPDCKGTGLIAKRVLKLDIGKVCKTCGGSGYVPR